VVIAGGDGSTSAGVISGAGSTLTVTGSQTYADPVNDNVPLASLADGLLQPFSQEGN
jgi:hypothetical protein